MSATQIKTYLKHAKISFANVTTICASAGPRFSTTVLKLFGGIKPICDNRDNVLGQTDPKT